jgi:hypothetical protein
LSAFVSPIDKQGEIAAMITRMVAVRVLDPLPGALIDAAENFTVRPWGVPDTL